MEYIYHTNNNANSFCRAHIQWLGRRCSTRFAGSLHCKKKIHISFKNLKQNTILIRKKQENVRLKKKKKIYSGKAFLKRSVFRAFLKQECQELFHKNVYDVNTSNNVKDILYDTDVIIFIVKLLFIVLWVS